jgi:hypothetical protein
VRSARAEAEKTTAKAVATIKSTVLNKLTISLCDAHKRLGIAFVQESFKLGIPKRHGSERT